MQWNRGALFGVLALFLCLAGAAAWGAERFSFVIPGDDATPSVTDLSGMNRKPARADGFVRIRDGRFQTFVLRSGVATFTVGPEHRTLWSERAAE